MYTFIVQCGGTFYHDSRCEWNGVTVAVWVFTSSSSSSSPLDEQIQQDKRALAVYALLLLLHLDFGFDQIERSILFNSSDEFVCKQNARTHQFHARSLHTMFPCCMQAGTMMIKQTINLLFTTCSNNLFFTFTHRPTVLSLPIWWENRKGMTCSVLYSYMRVWLCFILSVEERERERGRNKLAKWRNPLLHTLQLSPWNN